PTKLYDSFPTISPDEAADLICEASRAKPKQINTRLGTFGEVLYALAPKAVDQILHMAYNVFPESAAASGKKDENERASGEAGALSHVMKGGHGWSVFLRLADPEERYSAVRLHSDLAALEYERSGPDW